MTLPVLLLLLGCGPRGEGAAAGECSDGADNDADGLFDCADPDCADALECALPPDNGGVVPGTTAPVTSNTGSETPVGTDPGDTGLTTTLRPTPTVVWVDDGVNPVDTDNDGLPDVGCGDSVTVTVVGGRPWAAFGMAETGSGNGWYGEDCLGGMYGFDLCHPMSGDSLTLAEVPDCLLVSVVAASHTLFDAAKDPYLTYYLEDIDGNCFVWGHDPSYYQPFCFVL